MTPPLGFEVQAGRDLGNIASSLQDLVKTLEHQSLVDLSEVNSDLDAIGVAAEKIADSLETIDTHLVELVESTGESNTALLKVLTRIADALEGGNLPTPE